MKQRNEYDKLWGNKDIENKLMDINGGRRKDKIGGGD